MFDPLKVVAVYSDPRFWVYAGTELAKASPILVQAYAFFLNWINSHNHYGDSPQKKSLWHENSSTYIGRFPELYMEKLFDVRTGLLWKCEKAQIHAYMEKTKIFLKWAESLPFCAFM